MRKLIVLTMTAVLAVSCSNTEKVAKVDDKSTETAQATNENTEQTIRWTADSLKLDESKNLLIGFQTGVCFGKCPTYKVYVYDDGSYDRVGMMFTATGLSYGKLEAGQLNEIKQLTDAINWKEIKEEYEFQPSDFPMVNMTFTVDGENKSMRYKAGEPENISNLARKLREIFDMYSEK